MNIKTFYLTTTLPYVNAAPHIGHALEFFQADAYARYFRKKLGKGNVFFNVGTDEHGLKNYQKAKELGKTPKEYVDEYAAKWKEFCELFNITYDNFYRTSDESHYKVAQKFWNESLANGDIYTKKYEGLYCVGCEEFKTEKELVDGKCPIHGTVPIEYAEENYFFKLSKYKDKLLEYYKNNPSSVKPEFKHQELANFIKNMEDISISRVAKNLPWGIPVPNDSEQVMYVWFDALTNYIGAIGYGTDEKKFNEWWNNNDTEHLTLQLFGPDNLRFQCAIWQGMLASVNINFTKKFLCHGTILASDGTKMSKTKGNVVSPFDQLKKFGVDIVRYYMLAVLPTYNDSAYSESDLLYTYNSNLANNFGNLLNRVIHLSNNRKIGINNYDKVEAQFKSKVDKQVAKIDAAYLDFDLKLAGDLLNELSDIGNKYIDSEKPWAIEEDMKAEEILNNLSYLLYHLVELYEPFIPTSAEKAREALKNREKIILFDKIDESILKEKEPINVEELLKPIVIAKVLGFEKHPNADKLQLVDIELGGKQKKVITGANNFKIGDLVPYLGEGNVIPGYLIMNGEKIILEKRMLRGLESDSMILAEDEIGLSKNHEGIYIIQGDDSLIGKSILEILTKQQVDQIKTNQK